MQQPRLNFLNEDENVITCSRASVTYDEESLSSILNRRDRAVALTDQRLLILKNPYFDGKYIACSVGGGAIGIGMALLPGLPDAIRIAFFVLVASAVFVGAVISLPRQWKTLMAMRKNPDLKELYQYSNVEREYARASLIEIWKLAIDKVTGLGFTTDEKEKCQFLFPVFGAFKNVHKESRRIQEDWLKTILEDDDSHFISAGEGRWRSGEQQRISETVVIHCPHCRAKMRIKTSQFRKKGRCRKCREVFAAKREDMES